jgi:hypothetical protein
MNWYEWETLELFNAWHDALCLELGYPIYGINEATGEIDTSTQPTTAYTDSFQVADKTIATVQDQHCAGLTLTNLRPPKPPRYNEAQTF